MSTNYLRKILVGLEFLPPEARALLLDESPSPDFARLFPDLAEGLIALGDASTSAFPSQQGSRALLTGFATATR